MPDPQQPELDPLEDSPSSRRMSLVDEADAVIAETEAELAQEEQAAAAAAAAAAANGRRPVVDTALGEWSPGGETPGKTLTPLGKQWVDGMAADMARRAGARAPDPTSVSVPRSLAEMSMFEAADGPEADEAWRSLVAKHPDAVVIDDFLIALPSEGEEKSQHEPEPEMQATAAEPEPEPAAQEQTLSREEETAGVSQPLVPLQRKHGLLRRLGLPLVWIAALLWVWQIVRTKRLRPPSGAVLAAAGAP